MRTVWAHHDANPDLYRAFCAFAASRIWDRPKEFTLGTAMAVVDCGKVVAVTVFHDYDADAGVIQISAAADSAKWLTRPVLLEMFGYAFNELGCQAVVALVDPENKRLERIFGAYGFDRYFIPRLRGRDKGEALYLLTEEAWRDNGFHKEAS